MDSDYLYPFSVLIVVLAGVLALLAGAASVVAARSIWRRWESRFDSTGRRLALVAAGITLFLLLLVLMWVLLSIVVRLMFG
jgi:hypothetical protein